MVESLEFEYDESPLAIMDKVIQTEDDNITQQVKLDIETVSQNWRKKACNLMKIQLCQGGLFLKRKLILDTYFHFKNQAEMLAYHNSFDVFIAKGPLN